MKKLTCEMCGSVDLLKNEGMFVCQSCGTKYSVEEAKKMMIEGVVDVQGVVKVDNSQLVEKYLQNARRAKQKEDWEETEKYYNLVEQNDPQNIEAIFYSAYGKAKTSLTDSDIYKREAIFKVLTNCISMIDDNFDIAKEEEQRKIVQQISADIILMVTSSYVYNSKKDGYGSEVWNDTNKTQILFNNLHAGLIDSLDNIVTKYENNSKLNETDYLYELMITHYTYLIKTGKLSRESINYYKEKLMQTHIKLSEVNPEHQVPNSQQNDASVPTGCSAATVVYIIIIIVIILMIVQ